MIAVLLRVNSFLEHIGSVVAKLLVALGAVGFMLFPGMALAYLLYHSLGLLLGREESLTALTYAKLVTASAIFWYIGSGLSGAFRPSATE